MTTIFPISCVETEKITFGYLDPPSAVCLSGVNRNAYQALSNDKFFWALFAKQYPLLSKADHIFSEFRTSYPESYWKIICSLPPEKCFHFKKEFLERGCLKLIEELKVRGEMIKKEKQKAAQQLKDKNSPLGPARRSLGKACAAARRACSKENSRLPPITSAAITSKMPQELRQAIFDILIAEINPIMEEMRNSIHPSFVETLKGAMSGQTGVKTFDTAVLLLAILLPHKHFFELLSQAAIQPELLNKHVFENPYFSDLICTFWLGSDPAILSRLKLSALLTSFDESSIGNYRKTAFALCEKKAAFAFIKVLHHKSFLDHLCKEIKSLEEEIECHSLNLINIQVLIDNPEQHYRACLYTVLCFINHFENICHNHDYARIICEMSYHLRNVIDLPPEQKQGYVVYLKDIIGGFKTLKVGSLDPARIVFRCYGQLSDLSSVLQRENNQQAQVAAQGLLEPQYSEMLDHPELLSPHLFNFRQVAGILRREINSFLKGADQNFDLFMRICLDRNFDAIREGLGVLKELQVRLSAIYGSPESEHKKVHADDRLFWPLSDEVNHLLLLVNYEQLKGREDYSASVLLSRVSKVIEEIERRLSKPESEGTLSLTHGAP